MTCRGSHRHGRVTGVNARSPGVGVTHQAIRPDNVFHSVGQPIILGAAWAAPPAALPRFACRPEGGRGHPPTISMHSVCCCSRCAVYSYRTWTTQRSCNVSWTSASTRRLSDRSGFALGLPSWSRLCWRKIPITARWRRCCYTPRLRVPAAPAARPARQAQRPLEIGGVAIWTARQAAYVLATNPVQGIPALRNGRMDHWLRHGLANAGIGLPG